MIAVRSLMFLVILLFSLSEYCNDGLAEIKSDYILYMRQPFEIITPFSKPQLKEIGKKLSIFAVPGEYEPATFIIFARKALENVRVKITELKSSEDVIPEKYLDVRVVKAWYQAGTTNEFGRKVLVPELLLKNDNLITVDLEKKQNILHFKGIPQDSHELSPFTVPGNTSKEIWITIKVPDNIKPGLFHGKIYLISQNQPPKNLDFELNILPICLSSLNKFYAIYYYNTLDQRKQDEENYKNELRDIKEHGFNSTLVIEGVKVLGKRGNLKTNFTDLKRAFDIRTRLGFIGPLIYRGFEYGTPEVRKLWLANSKEAPSEEDKRLLSHLTVELQDLSESNKYPTVWFYGIDEPQYGPKRLEACKILFSILKATGAKPSPLSIKGRPIN